ncbi:MAG: hypothetical protein WCT03_21050 [Candidatus Obscuribacterales bacterium]|jgi:hypothetical protein
MHPIDFFFNTICCNIYLALCAFFFIHEFKKLKPGKMIVSATLLRAIVCTWAFVSSHPRMFSILPEAYYMLLFWSTLLPVFGALALFKRPVNFGIAGGFLFLSLYFLECGRVIMMNIINPPSMFQ